MSRYWSEGLADLDPYVPGEQPRDQKTYIKLNTNESPYPPSPRVIQAIRDAASSSLRLYPDPTCMALRETIGGKLGLPESRVFAGNGSDEILAFAFAAFFRHPEPLLFPDISYSFYPVYARFFGQNAQPIQTRADFSIPLDEFLVPNAGIALANPNAPTGRGIDPALLLPVLEHNRALGRVVLVDEAYVDFGGTSAAPLVGEFPNLLVVQTLSKSRSLAGLRAGFALGQEELIEGLERVKSSINSYTLDRLALAGAKAALEDEEYFQETRAKIMATRENATRSLRYLGFDVIPSQANFLFASHPEMQASRIYAELKAAGVLVRHFNKPRIENYLRISVGTDEDMSALAARLSAILGRPAP
ncbi:MAG TPA: histidinol-phosphate transaminase [Rectinemataceae bacterium]